jgi:hypothetical protein
VRHDQPLAKSSLCVVPTSLSNFQIQRCGWWRPAACDRPAALPSSPSVYIAKSASGACHGAIGCMLSAIPARSHASQCFCRCSFTITRLPASRAPQIRGGMASLQCSANFLALALCAASICFDPLRRVIILRALGSVPLGSITVSGSVDARSGCQAGQLLGCFSQANLMTRRRQRAADRPARQATYKDHKDTFRTTDDILEASQ